MELSRQEAASGERNVDDPAALDSRSYERGGAVARVRDLLRQIVSAADLDIQVVVREDAQGVFGEFAGRDAEVLLADHGRTLDAIQHLAYRTAFAGATPRKSVVVDAAGYRARRAESLRAAADQAVHAAIDQGRPVALEPMNAMERKLVHEHLRGRRGVETYSEGEEPQRRLVVAPVVAAQQ